MPKSDERMDIISTAIRTQADAQSKEIIAKANAYRDSQLAICLENAEKEMKLSIQEANEKFKLDIRREISQEEKTAYNSLFMHREKITNSVFNDVKLKLIEFTKSPKYIDWLIAKLSAISDSYDHSQSKLCLRNEDMHLKTKVTEILNGCTVEQTNEIAIGGFVVYNQAAGVRIDETFEVFLDAQKPWFLQNCGLHVQ